MSRESKEIGSRRSRGSRQRVPTRVSRSASADSQFTTHDSRSAYVRRKWISCISLGAGALVVAAPTQAFTIEHSATRYADKRYQCELTVKLDAPVERVEAVLRDYEHYPTLDARIVEARVLERPEAHVALLATTLRACFGPFCRNVKRIERVEERPNALAAITDAARSDVRFGETRTELESVEGGTRVTYRTSIAPGFWIPPIAGRRWMLRTLEAATSNLFMNVEMRAQAEAGAAREAAISEEATIEQATSEQAASEETTSEEADSYEPESY